MMQVAVNYSAATAGLYKAGRIQVDRYKCPDWPDLISSAQRILPAVAADPANGDVLQRDNDGGQDGPGVIFVGIDICEDDFLNRGLGTEA